MLERLAEHPTPIGLRRLWGRLGSKRQNRCQFGPKMGMQYAATLPGWGGEPEFRSYATLFVSRALRHPGVTCINISARPATRPITIAQGFSQYSKGNFYRISSIELLVTIERRARQDTCRRQSPEMRALSLMSCLLSRRATLCSLCIAIGVAPGCTRQASVSN